MHKTSSAHVMVCTISSHTLGLVCQLPLIDDAALLPEDRDVAEERKRVLECQPVVESMVGSPLILQELSKVCSSKCVSKHKKKVVRMLRCYLSISGVQQWGESSGCGQAVSRCRERRMLWPAGLQWGREDDHV